MRLGISPEDISAAYLENAPISTTNTIAAEVDKVVLL
jgi:hypothetical protein